ncbi:MAG TPA: PAS domain-containing protein [Bryobacteraceae bacterium]|nr:PAS domain-containing protein [Bryobacteraceae bacterium]
MYVSTRKPLRSDQVTSLIAACVNARQKLVILGLIETGLRAHELIRLEGSDINWGEGTLRVAGRLAPVTASPEVISLLSEQVGAGRKVRLGVRQIQRIVRDVARSAGINSIVTPDVLQRTWQETSKPSGLSGRRRERVLEAAADEAMDLILIVDDERRFVDLNRAASKVLGQPREEIIGRRIEDFFSEAQGEPVSAAWSTFVVEGEQRGICRLKSASRKTFEYRAKAHFRHGLHLSILREIPGDALCDGET